MSEEEEESFQVLANPIYSCKPCKKVFTTKREQILHKRDTHSHFKSAYECKMCSKFFVNNGNLERHMKVHCDIRPHKCVVCEKSFSQAVNLQRHYSVHSGDRPYVCSYCPKAFTQQSNMRRHELTHTGEKPFGCKRCNRQFSQRINLKKHIMGHLNSRPYMCSICQKTFIQSNNYKKHLKVHLKEGKIVDQASLEALPSIKMSESYTFQCVVCNMVFNNFANFETHESSCTADREAAEAKNQNMQDDILEPLTQYQTLTSYAMPPNLEGNGVVTR